MRRRRRLAETRQVWKTGDDWEGILDRRYRWVNVLVAFPGSKPGIAPSILPDEGWGTKSPTE